MSKNRITAIVAAVTFAGFMHALAAQEKNVEASQSKDTAGQNISSGQKPLVETSTPVAMTPAQAFVPPAEKLLSEMKVYPSF